MIRAVQTAADKAAFAAAAAAWPGLRAVLGRDLALWADNPGAPVKLFCITDDSGQTTAALDLYGRNALLAGTVGQEQERAGELAAFLRFAGIEKLRTVVALAPWAAAEREPLFCYRLPAGQALPARPLPAGCTPDTEPSTTELARLLFPDDAARRDAYYVTTNAARSRGLARQWLLRAPDGAPVSTVGAGAIWDSMAYLDMGYTVPAARGKGCFAPLIVQAANTLAGQGSTVTLDCAETLCPLYEKLGFRRFGIIRQYNTNRII